MAELYAEQAESAPAEGRGAAASGRPGPRKAAADEARGAQTFAVTSAPAATPIADMVEAMRSRALLGHSLWRCGGSRWRRRKAPCEAGWRA